MRRYFLLMLVLVGCQLPKAENMVPDTGDTAKAEMELTEINQKKLIAAVPPPELDTSLERKNLRERLIRLNKENAVGHVYLLSNDGKVLGYYPVAGKVSSLNSYMTSSEQILRVPNGCHSATSCATMDNIVVESPDFDGAYGQNDPEGIFFFTYPDKVYVEWKGPYLYSDSYLPLEQKPIFTVDATKQYVPSTSGSK